MSRHAIELLTKREVAVMLGGASEPVSVAFVEKLLRLRRLPRVKISPKCVRVPRAAVEDYISKRTINSVPVAG